MRHECCDVNGRSTDAAPAGNSRSVGPRSSLMKTVAPLGHVFCSMLAYLL